MSDTDFQPKLFYRKFDSLLVRIEENPSTRDLLFQILDELVQSFKSDLRIRSGCIYHMQFGSFRLVRGPVGEPGGGWPLTMSKDEPVFKILYQHKSYIFADSEVAPWGGNSIATMLGDFDEYLLVFRLDKDWVRETLQFSMNTIRSTINLSQSTNRFSADMQEAFEIQKSLLPESDPKFEGYDISGRSVPAERVGGDLYDFNILDEEILSFAIGDASGHGLPAALLARDIMTGLRMGIENEMKISGVIRKLNRVIHQSRLSTKFVSLVFGEMERNGTLVYINAGHPPPLHFKKDAVNRLDVGGTILGPLSDSVFKRGFAFMDPGDTLLMYTDGIIEITRGDGEMFGEERLIDLVRRHRGEPSPVVIDEIYRSVIEFGGGDRPKDDASVIVIKRLD